MKDLESFLAKYSSLPKEIKEANRWVCYRKLDKIPMNALTGKKADVSNSLTWTTFNVAISGCVKYDFDGIGFMLGNGVFGVDLDNHKNENGEFEFSPEEFKNLSNEFISNLNSYSERSQSGNGIHIICKGKLPEGQRRKGNVEMYDSGRYFAMTGDVVNDMSIENREKEIIPLWKKYVNTPIMSETRTYTTKNDDGSVTFGNVFDSGSSFRLTSALDISDSELIDRIKSSKNGVDFVRLYVNGDLSMNGDDHSSADLSLCSILAFWCGKDAARMDRIFRSSALMRDKWDRKTGKSTYGEITIAAAIKSTIDTYNPPRERVDNPVFIKTVQANNIVSSNNEQNSNIDENGDPIVQTSKKSFKPYTLDDTGNAERFYDEFGYLFKYNADNKIFMFWDNKTWIKDSLGYVKKYANKLIEILRAEVNSDEKKLLEASKNDELTEEEAKTQENILKAKKQNVSRLSNKSGKDAMCSELQHIHLMPTQNKDYDTYDNYLNTLSGVVDLTTGQIMDFNPKLMLSKNTFQKVSYEEPTLWIKFLHDIFKRDNPDETEELVECMQMALGYSFTGRTNKEYIFFLYGNGSNGKSTFVETVRKIAGDYGQTMNSDLLIQKPGSSSQSTEFAMSALLGARFIATSETAEGKVLDAVSLKRLTGGEDITAQFKYGQPFHFPPTFSVFMSTNNKPIIRDTDFGTWRRLFYFPFLRTFTDKDKDINLPKKLLAESDKILGWIIQGNVKLIQKYNGILPKPKCVEEALADYKNEMDVINAFINTECVIFPGYKTRASILYQDYKRWALSNTEYCMSETKFGNELKKKGYEKKRDNKGFYYLGLKLNTDSRGQIFEKEYTDD